MLQRLLIDRMEHRILVGITSFVMIMVLVGWVAINENARMASFEQQQLARSIERGAKLFAANCSTCHGTDGRGLAGRAPGLNSPQFFGHDFFAEFAARREALTEEQFALSVELAEGAEGARREEILARLAGINSELAQVEVEFTAQQTAMAAALVAGYQFEEPDRLAQVTWVGTRFDYIRTTLIHGRPTSVSYWPQPMSAWSERAGGPLRDDEIEDLANYILNYDKGDGWTLEDALLVKQYAIEPGLGGGGGVESVGTDVAAILTSLEGMTGDASRGDALYHGTALPENPGLPYGCAGCHEGGASAPPTAGTYDRVLTERLAALPDYTPQQYLVESIVLPQAYLVDGYAANMPEDFGARMTIQDLADVIAYLETTGAQASAGDTN